MKNYTLLKEIMYIIFAKIIRSTQCLYLVTQCPFLDPKDQNSTLSAIKSSITTLSHTILVLVFFKIVTGTNNSRIEMEKWQFK